MIPTWLKYILAFSAIAIIILLIVFRKNIFGSRLLKCINTNVLKQNGTECITCSDDKSPAIIVNGKCYGVPMEFLVAESGLRHTNENGVYYYQFTRGGNKDIQSKEDFIKAYISYIKRLPKEVTQSI